MKRWLVILFLFSLACIVPTLSSVPAPTEIPIEGTLGLTPTTLAEPVLQPTFTPTPHLVSTPTYDELPVLGSDSVNVYPTHLYPDDYYSIDVVPYIPPNYTDLLTLIVGLPDGESVYQKIEPAGLDGRKRARLVWIDQVPSNASAFTLTLKLDIPGDLHTTLSTTEYMTTAISVLPVNSLRLPEPFAQWMITQTKGFNIHYISETKAARDLVTIVSEANQVYGDISEVFGESRQPVDIYILDRVVGQGGYASSEWVALSYLDRSYSPIDLSSFLRYALTHRLDSAIGCSEAPAFLREGLAVFMAGGHYREEPIIRKASTALSNGYEIPFTQLLENFYIQQHEVSYLEAAAFITFIEQQYGWDGLETLCTTASKTRGTEFEKLDAATQVLTKEDFYTVVDQYRLWLSQQPVTPVDRELLDYELRLMDVMRQYQSMYDPSAHFLRGILFSPQQAEEQDIVADFVRRPISEQAVALELLLSAGQDAIFRQDTPFASTIVSILESVLIDGNQDLAVFNEIAELVSLTRKYGYDPYNLTFLGNRQYEVNAMDLNRWPKNTELTIVWSGDKWIITGSR